MTQIKHNPLHDLREEKEKKSKARLLVWKGTGKIDRKAKRLIRILQMRQCFNPSFS